jgi:hypothetical protein
MVVFHQNDKCPRSMKHTGMVNSNLIRAQDKLKFGITVGGQLVE